MVQMSATTLPFMQAARDSVKGYVFERGIKIRFHTVWLEKPQGEHSLFFTRHLP